MSALPRGSCPDCKADVALRRGGEVREHADRREPGRPGWCEGSGKPNGCRCEQCRRATDPRPVASIDPCPGCPWWVVSHVGEDADAAAARHQAGTLHTAWRERRAAA